MYYMINFNPASIVLVLPAQLSLVMLYLAIIAWFANDFVSCTMLVRIHNVHSIFVVQCHHI